MGSDPFKQFATGLPGQPVLDEAQRMLCIPVLFKLLIDHWKLTDVLPAGGQCFSLLLECLHHKGVVVVAYKLRISRLKSFVFPGVDIAKVPGNVHVFVVADQQMHVPAGLFRLFLELLQVLDNFERVRASVRDIAYLHQMRIAGDPLSATVNDAGFLKHRHVVVVVAVHVADCHDSPNPLPVILNRCRCRRHEEYDQRERSQPAPDIAR